MMTEENTLYPTFSCFDDAMHFIEYVWKNYPSLDEIFVVHAIGKAHDEGETRYSHGWVEDHNVGVCIYAGYLKGVKVYMCSPIEEYYSKFKFIETTKYTPKQAITLNLKHGTFGPWEPKYVALCNDGVEHIVLGGVTDVRAKLMGPLPITK
jgi:hypothetical protein